MRRSAVARVALGTEPPGHVAVEAKSSSSGVVLRFSLSDSESESGSFRLRQIARTCCELDSVLSAKLLRGHEVERSIAAGSPGHDGDPPFRDVEMVAPLVMPVAVGDELFPFQRHGVAFLLTHDRCLLADDMGLGKTVQAIAALRRAIRWGMASWALVVAPSTLVDNWISEVRKFAPELTVGAAMPGASTREAEWRRVVRRCHVLVTSYEQIRTLPDALVHNPPPVLVADEAHRLRRRESQTYQAFRQLASPTLWALSGTPLERSAEDIAVLMSLLEPQRFSAEDASMHPTQLRARIRPYVLRRSKADVLSELPPVVERHERLPLTDEQRTSYRELIGDFGRRRSDDYLALFGALRRCADLDPKSRASSKLDRICEVLAEVAAAVEKAVVFSHTIAPLEELAARLQVQGVEYELLTGALDLGSRADLLDRFRTRTESRALLASTGVAAEGLTLTEANHVVFINRWWNPTSNAQARDRVVRIGQERTVFVWTFTSLGTVEERLDSILESKEADIESVVTALELGRGDPTAIRGLVTE
jgi:SNF2 family DNA or RNA helicase